MVRKSDAVRNREQKERQRALRAKLKAEKRPGRDDVARVALHWMISRMTTKAAHDVLAEMEGEIVAALTGQGFDQKASYEVFDGLVEKYGSSAWDFRRKPHLLFTPDVLTED